MGIEFSSIGNFDKVTVLGLSGTNAWGLDNLKYGNQQSSEMLNNYAGIPNRT